MKLFNTSLLIASMMCSGISVFAQREKEPKLSDFTSVPPNGQTQTIVLPETHTFQMIAKSGVTQYSNGQGTIGSNNDFTAFIPQKGKGKRGILSVNHETSPGGVSLIDLTFNPFLKLWENGEVRAVDFSEVQGTVRNCSGGITPWGTVITSEESVPSKDENTDGLQDIGWQVEIDPVTGKIMDYDKDGKPDKLWSHGRFNHENIAVSKDGYTTYQAEDGGSSCVFKFVADKRNNLSKGTLYVLKRDTSITSAGTWIEVPGDTNTLNNLRTIAPSLGGTNWRNPEDIEFGPDGKMYFTSKGTGDIWRFKDNGKTVSEIEAWVTNQQYMVEYEGGSQLENWGTGIDNLAFDNEGVLWAQQDGGRNNLWVIYPDHTPQKPSLKLFMTTPSGSESTGLTFSPDGKYGFLSIQHPGSGNTQEIKDAAGKKVVFDRDVTLVFARNEHLGREKLKKEIVEKIKMIASKMIQAYPNPFEISTHVKITMPEDGEIELEVRDIFGNMVAPLHKGFLAKGEHVFDCAPESKSSYGLYIVSLTVNGDRAIVIIKQDN